MQTKPSPLATLKALTAPQADELYDYLRTSPYYRAVVWVLEQYGLEVSISALQRWWNRQTRQRARRNLRTAIQASAQFDKDLDARALDARATNAIRAAFWQAISTNDIDSVKTLGTLVLDYNADSRDTTKLERILKAERDARAARAEAVTLRSEIATLKAALNAAGKANQADPAEVQAKLDAHLGLKKI